MDERIDLTYLSGKDPWAVRYTQKKTTDPKLSYTPISFSYRYTSYHDAANPNITDIARSLQENAGKKRAFLRGQLKQPLDKQPRSGMTKTRAVRTPLLFLDADGVEGVESAEDLLFDVLKLPKTHFIEHLSSSSGIKPHYRAHIILLLEDALSFETIAEWIWAKCLTIPLLAGQIKLDKAGAVLLPTLDPAASRPSQLFCIADPVFVPANKDPHHLNSRWRVETPTESLSRLPTDRITSVPDSSMVTQARGEITALLRSAQGLPKNSRVSTRKLSTDKAGNDWTLVTGASPTIVTSYRDVGAYTRLNLNGGDSESYWHRKGDAQYIYTFNGWLCYRGVELAPEYVEKVRVDNLTTQQDEANAIQERLEKGETIPFVMLDPQTEQYLCIGAQQGSTYQDVLRFTRMTSVQSWLHTNCYLPPFDKLPEVWTPIFDPDKPFIDPVNRTINQFTSPPVSSDTAWFPPLLLRLMLHVLGDDEDLLELFLTWLAYIYQTRQPTHSAWLFHGVQGTGKDLLFSILDRIFGPRYCTRVMPHLLKEAYTGWAENINLGFVNEVDSGVFAGTNLSSRLNDMITGKYLSVRRMRVDAYSVPNRTNLIFAANRMDAVVLPHGDRRYHIPPRQETPLKQALTPTEILELVALGNKESERIRQIRSWLVEREIPDHLSAPTQTEAKKVLAKASQPAAVRVSVDLANGGLSSIISRLDTFESISERVSVQAALALQDGITDMLVHLQEHRNEWLMTLTEIKTLYAVLCDPRVWFHGAVKFAQYAAHNELPDLLVEPPISSRAKYSGRYYLFECDLTPDDIKALQIDLVGKGFNIHPTTTLTAVST